MNASQAALEKAFDNFAKINHLAGMYLSKKHLKEVISLLHIGEEEFDVTELEKQVEAHQTRFYLYVKEFGLEHSECSISRKQGEEESLLSELVLTDSI